MRSSPPAGFAEAAVKAAAVDLSDLRRQVEQHNAKISELRAGINKEIAELRKEIAAAPWWLRLGPGRLLTWWLDRQVEP